MAEESAEVRQLGRRAVVIGGSIAGMLAARVLSETFGEVIVLEADQPPEGMLPRKRVPQGHHSHLLLLSGQQVLDRLFPGFTGELVAAGSVETDFTGDMAWYHFGEWKQRFRSGLRNLQQTRPFLEWHLRRRLGACRNVTVRYGAIVEGLVLTPGGDYVSAVKLREGRGGTEELSADFFVDASGAGSQSLQWLTGREPSAETTESVRIGLCYATRYYHGRPEDKGRPWRNLLISSQLPELPGFGVILSYEDGKTGVTVGSYLGEAAATEEAFLKQAQSLPQPHVYDYIREAEPLGEIRTYRIPAQQRRRPDRISRLPGRLVMLGDAYCRFDPIYGQGMSVAAMEAELLQRELSGLANGSGLDTLHRRYYRELVKLTDYPWEAALTEAFRHPAIPGDRPPGLRLKQWLTTKIYRASAKDELVYTRLVQAMNLTHAQSVLLHPSVLVRLLR
ncbi:FAD-dependent oxidoreductase [Paenibacillus sp. S-38]|uniref:FAD-dependent oxidoreductase n=1 Tax=Paenibacillus sp. S-38 TaxID=3416710 RepID=UPI003CEA39D1